MLEFHDCEKNISEQEIWEVENKLGVFFPADFKAHYLKWNGGTPNKLKPSEINIRGLRDKWD